MIRLIWFELEKLRRNRILLAMSCFILLVNMVLYHTSLVSRDTFGFSALDECALYKELADLDDSEKLISVQKKLQAMKQTGTPSNGLVWEEKLYEKAEAYMLRTLSYEETLRHLKENAEQMTQSSVFSDPNSFSFRNAKCTAERYALITDAEIPIMYSGGFLRIVNSQISDMCFVLATILMVLALWPHEYEQGYLKLIQATKHGRAETVLAKFTALFLVQLLLFLVLYGADLILVTRYVGLGDLSNPIQSVDGFLLSPLQITTGQYLFLFYAYKSGAFLAISLAFMTISMAIKSSVVSCMAFGLLLFIELAAYVTIPTNSYLSLFKQANLIALFDTNTYFSTYATINFFEYPIALVTVMKWMVLLIFILSVPLSICLSKPTIFLRLPTQKFHLPQFHRRPKIYPTSLWYFECYKLFWVQKGLWVLLLCAVIQIGTYAGYGERHIGTDQFYYMQYLDTLSSMSTSQKEAFLSEEDARFHEAHQALQNLQTQYDHGEISASARDYFCSEQLQILAPEKAFSMICEQYTYLQHIGETDLINQVPYTLLFGARAKQEDLVDVVKVVFCIAVSLSSIWAYEEDQQMSKLIISSISGRKKTMSAKFLVSLFYNILLILIVFLPKYLAVWQNVGLPGLWKPAVCCPLLSFLPRTVSMFSYLLMQNLCRLFGALCFSALVIFASCKTKSTIGTIAFSLLMGLFPIAAVAFDLSKNGCVFSLLPAMSGHCLTLKYWWVYLLALFAVTLLLIGTVHKEN